MTLAVILAFLGASVLLYVLLAGADFGAGILELFLGRNRRADARELVSHAMAPVWEANHIWLILAVVILFMAFPAVYTALSVYLFVPMVAVLVGIVGRGTAFTFRHYDVPAREGPPILSSDWSRVYTRIFAGSSLWTSAWLGVLAGAMVLGRVDPGATDVVGLYVRPWANVFCLAMAGFAASMCALLAAVYLVGEADDEELRAIFRRDARVAAAVVVGAGACVFVAAEASDLSLVRAFFGNSASVAAFVLATALLFPFGRAVRYGGATATRMFGAAVVTLVLLGWFAVQYPVAIRLAHGAITFPEAAAPLPTQRALLGALIVGSLLIFPSLGYLFRVFKWETFEREP